MLTGEFIICRGQARAAESGVVDFTAHLNPAFKQKLICRRKLSNCCDGRVLMSERMRVLMSERMHAELH